jgi:hypothetical protein
MTASSLVTIFWVFHSVRVKLLYNRGFINMKRRSILRKMAKIGNKGAMADPYMICIMYIFGSLYVPCWADP